MSAKSSRSEIKGALKGLDIATPTRISRTLEFAAPRSELSHNKEPHDEQPRNQPPQVADTQSGFTPNSQGLDRYDQNEAAQFAPAQKKVAQNETARDERPRYEPAQPARTSRDGFFRMATRLFDEPRLRALSGEAFRVFLWMSSQAWRYRDSDGRVKASTSLISRCTGVSEATVSRCLAALLSAKLIERLQVDYMLGNLWRVEPVAVAQVEAAQNEHTQLQGAAPSSRGGSTIISRRQPPQNEVHSKKDLDFKDSKSLPLDEIADETLRVYFRDLKPAGKRESEWAAYRELRADYGEGDLARAIGYLQLHGVGGGGSFIACHSPVAYLTRAMPQVLAEVLARDHEQSMRQSQVTAKVREAIRIKDEERAEAVEWAIKEAAFMRAYPETEQQKEVIAEACISSPFKAASAAGRAFAISRWWASSKKNDEGALNE